jgi:hypothetical protein
MADNERRNPLMPWFIGLAIVVAADLYVAYLFLTGVCQAPGIAQVFVVVVIPVVYLALMYLTFKSQP